MIRRFAALGLLCSLLTHSGTAQDSSFFRQNGGVAADDSAKLPTEFSDANLVWKADLKPGVSTPCVYGDSIFVTSYDDEAKSLSTICLDRATGKKKWAQRAPIRKLEQFHRTGSPACSTPACDGQRVFVMFGSYGLLCYGIDGKLLWKQELGPFQDEFGAASSPIIAGDKVIINEDHDIDCFLMAFDKKTGKALWKTPRPGFTRSYSSPILIKHGGKNQIVVAGSLKLTGYDVETGNQVWLANGFSRIVDTTPVQVGNHIYIATWTPGGDSTNRISMEPFEEALEAHDKNGDKLIAKSELPDGSPVAARFFRIDLNLDQKLNKSEWLKHAKVFELAQNAAMAVRLGGKGDVSKTHIEWKYTKGIPTVPSPVVYRDVLYMVKDSGVITGLNAKDGSVVKQGRAKGRGNYYASPVAGDGKVYFISERGVMTIVKAGSPWQIIGQHDFGDRIMATPVIDANQMLIRTNSGLLCYDAK